MRLIDKDRLLKGSNHYWLEMEDFGDIESIDVRFVEMAEEVKAIPIEWLKRYEITKGQEVRLQDAINEWEKENETD